MNSQFWLNRWREGRIGWHSDMVNPSLAEYWGRIGAPLGCRVLVPLCGKSLDMAWLAERGHSIVGVELSSEAVNQFFAERGLQPTIHASGEPPHHIAEPYDLVEGNIFKVGTHTFAACQAVYDRAALVALDPTKRKRYARHVYGHLPTECRGLMITFEYPPDEMEGPPFSVPEEEVRALLGGNWQIDRLDRRDILPENPGFQQRGLSELFTAVYRLHKR